MRVLVLGADGVIGSAFAHHVEQQGHSVVRWDITLDPSHDLRVQESLYFILKNIDFVAFFAFDVGGSKYSTESAYYISNNMKLLENTFDALRKSGVPFIHTTSQMSNMDHNPYGPLKRIAEFYTEYLGGINIKVWNVYGPEHVSDKSHAIADFIHQARTTGSIRMLTTGEETRQFLHTNDFAEAACHIMENFDSVKQDYGTMIDISNYEWVSIRSVADIIADVYQATVYPGTIKSTFQTKVNESRPDFLRSGWKPKISLKEGIEGLCNE
jgi:nucleoside-diphosphate-sugar epimerase